MDDLKILIVGASIAGPTAAYWFARAGANVTIIERFPSLRAGGQNVDIRSAGVTVMRRMDGMEAAVRAKSTKMDGISFVRSDGRPFGTIKATGNPDQQSLVSEFEIFRGDLARILFDLTEHNKKINYVFGEQVAAIQQSSKEGGPVTVEFANGYPTADFDLVVACDGATSRTRALGFSCDIRDHVEPTNCWAAYFSTPQDFLEKSQLAQAYSCTGGRFMALGPDPSGGNRVGLMGIHPRNGHDAVQPFREALKSGDVPLKQFIYQHYRNAGWRSDDILKSMMEADDLYGSEIMQVKPPSLFKGGFVLVGDAGYAPGFTGGGTTLALVGAFVLAGEISRHPGDIAAGLQSYEQQMRPIITDLQKIPPFFKSIFAPQTALGIWFRNNIFAFIAWTRILELIQRFFAGSFASSDRHKLVEYEAFFQTA